MSPRLPNIISLTADYDAIEKAIRETSRGRWFLAAYLERNRSAETHMLLNAIGKLETAMRESGHMVDKLTPMETLAALREDILAARHEIARAKKREGTPAWLPLPRFTFESVPAAVAEETRTIKAAAASLDTAAAALRNAGVFQGVAREVAARAEDIRQACEAQDEATRSMSRMAALLSELEAEIMGTLDVPPPESSGGESEGATVRSMAERESGGRREIAIPPEVVEELTAALNASLAGRAGGEPH
jgi:t-SNARE complex subunit (syntaxin)